MLSSESLKRMQIEQEKLDDNIRINYIKREKIDDYDTEELQASQLNYFTPYHTHYCLR